jgi:DNA-directed RNA polymerase specialized sigma24 family protein
MVDRGPSPLQAAMLTETIEQLFRLMEDGDRSILEDLLLGYTAKEAAARLDCSERTVRRVRQRAKHCLRTLIEADHPGA